MRFIITPAAAPGERLDLTETLTAAIAEELWRRYGGNDRLNWFEAETHLNRFLATRGQERVPPGLRAASAGERRAADGRKRTVHAESAR